MLMKSISLTFLIDKPVFWCLQLFRSRFDSGNSQPLYGALLRDTDSLVAGRWSKRASSLKRHRRDQNSFNHRLLAAHYTLSIPIIQCPENRTVRWMSSGINLMVVVFCAVAQPVLLSKADGNSPLLFFFLAFRIEPDGTSGSRITGSESITN